LSFTLDSTSSHVIIIPEPAEIDPEEARKLLEANEELESTGSSADNSAELGKFFYLSLIFIII